MPHTHARRLTHLQTDIDCFPAHFTGIMIMEGRCIDSHGDSELCIIRCRCWDLLKADSGRSSGRARHQSTMEWRKHDTFQWEPFLASLKDNNRGLCDHCYIFYAHCDWSKIDQDSRNGFCHCSGDFQLITICLDLKTTKLSTILCLDYISKVP